MTQIKQGTIEWLEVKQTKISGSEIFSLVHHYCAKELQEMGFCLSKERPFRTIQELFMKVLFDVQLSDIDPMHSEFGNGMESYVAYRLQQELPKIEITQTKEFIINDKFHELAACSPDGYLRIMNDYDISDFDNTCSINSSWNTGMLELKTANYFANFEEGGSKLQYLFQVQFNMMITCLKWGCLAVILPKEKEFDDPFFKGKALIMARTQQDIDKYYDLKYFIYPQLPKFQNMIIKSLNYFQRDLDAYKAGDQKAYPRASEDMVGLQREKKLWGQLWPDHFGDIELEQDDELNALLNERMVAQEQSLFAEQAFKKITNEICQNIKARGYDKFCNIIGTENRLSFIKNGQMRFYKLKKGV